MHHTSLPPIASNVRPSEGVEDLVREFVDNLPNRLASMEATLRGGALLDLRVLAHQLRGAGGGFGFPEVTVVAGRLEDAIAGDESRTELEQRFCELASLCGRVVHN